MDEVGLKWWSQWIALPTDTEDFFTSLACDGVVEGYHKRLIVGKMLQQAVSGLAKQCGFIDAVPGVKAVVGSPVEMLSAAGANKITEGASILIE